MGVTTTADLTREKIDEKLLIITKTIRENLKDVRILTIETFDPETWGADQYREGLEQEYHDIANDLQEILKKLQKFN